MRGRIRDLPLIGPALQGVWRAWVRPAPPFPGSSDYWRLRYERGGNSGAGSYNRLAEFKAEILNELVSEKSIKTVIEFGCGDGSQLQLAAYPRYLGFDVSAKAVAMCKD